MRGLAKEVLHVHFYHFFVYTLLDGSGETIGPSIRPIPDLFIYFSAPIELMQHFQALPASRGGR